ncbi:MAG: four helix bundle protein [Marinoscillum sp.]
MHDYKKLDVWTKSMDFCQSVYQLTSDLPESEKFGLANQLRRASTSVPSNIAEGAGRGSNADFGRFLSIALGSVFEMETQLYLLVRLGYKSELDINKYLLELGSIGKMIHSLKKNLKSV